MLAHTALVSVSGGFSVTTGGDYGWGYVTSSLAPNLGLAVGESYTLTWTIRPLRMTGDIVTAAHAESATARLRLRLVRHVYRVLLPQVYRNRSYAVYHFLTGLTGFSGLGKAL